MPRNFLFGLLAKRPDFLGAFLFVPTGISRLLAASAPILGHMRQKENPGSHIMSFLGFQGLSLVHLLYLLEDDT